MNDSTGILEVKDTSNRPHFGNLKTRSLWCYPTLGRQSYVYKISALVSHFCLLQIMMYQGSSLIWTLNFTLNFFKNTNNFYRMNDSQNENLLDWNLRYTMQRLKKFPKKSRVLSATYNNCEAHPKNYMYAGPE